MSRRAAARPALDHEAVMDDLREVLLGIACQIELTTGRDDRASEFLGIDLEEFSLGSMPGGHHDILRSVDLDRFHIARQVDAACAFALQTGEPAARLNFSEDDWNVIEIFVEGGPKWSYGGELTPLADEDSALRRTLDMARARMTLRHGFGLTIRELALLADIGETAVRTSLSAEGIRTEGKPAKVSADLAEPWLRRRRGYVPTMEAEEHAVGEETEAWLRDMSFASALSKIMDLRGANAETVAEDAKVDAGWLRSLMTEDPAECDVEALCRLAVQLRIDAPAFAGRAVADILARA